MTVAGSITYLDGRWLPDSRARVHVGDRGFLLGDGVFDAARTFHGRLFRLRDHARRLRASLSALELDAGLSELQWVELSEEAVHRNAGLLSKAGDVIVWQIVTRGGGSRATDRERATVCIRVRPIAFDRHVSDYDSGATAVTIPTVYSVDPNIKHISRLPFVLAELEASRRNPEARALLVDEAGRVREGTTFNIFAVIEDRLVTPPDSDALLGVSRATILQLASELALAVDKRALSADELFGASEVLISATSFCVLPITSIDGRRIGTGVPGRVSEMLLRAWGRLVGVDIVQQARLQAATGSRLNARVP